MAQPITPIDFNVMPTQLFDTTGADGSNGYGDYQMGGSTTTIRTHKDKTVQKTTFYSAGDDDSDSDDDSSCQPKPECPPDPCKKPCTPIARCDDKRVNANVFGCGSVGIHLSAGSFWVILLVVVLVVIVSYALMNRSKDWYNSLKKSSWIPPPYIFTGVWTILYFLFIWGFYRSVEGSICQSTRNWAVAIGVIFLFFSVGWAALFGMKLLRQAFLVQIILIILAIIWTVMVWRIDTAAGVLQLPLCIWLVYALFLNWQLITLNNL